MSEPITTAQERYIAKLVNTIGKERGQEVKQHLGLAPLFPYGHLTKQQAIEVIKLMILAKNRSNTPVKEIKRG